MPRAPVVILATLLAAILAMGCGNKHLDRGRAFAREGRIDDAVRELRAAVAQDPGDGDARIELGRIELKAGRPGAAIRQFEAALALGQKRIRGELAELLLRRGLARSWRDRDRHVDLLRAVELDARLAASLDERWRRAALLDGGVARWAAGDQQRARAIWGKLPNGAAVLEAVTSPSEASLEVLEVVADTLYRLGGARVALPLLEAYVRRDGPSRSIHAAAAAAHQELEPAAAPTDLSEVITIALDEWLAGRRDAWVDAELVSTVDREAGARAIVDFPNWIRPTIHRLRGDAVMAAAALRELPGDVPEEGNVLVAFELAAAGKRTPAAALLDNPPVEGAAPLRGDLAALVTGESAGAARAWRLAPLVDKDLRAALHAHAEPFVDAGRLASWENDAGATVLAPLGTQIRRTSSCGDGYQQVERAIRRDPALGAQAARDWIDGDLFPECRAFAVASLYLQLGDHARIVPILEELLALAPANATALRLMALSAARAKNPRRALSYLQEAEYWSRARGQETVIVAAALREAGFPIDAIFAARQALGFADGAIRWQLHEETIAAAVAADRLRDARTALAAYLAELPARLHGDARQRLARRTGEAWLGPELASPRDDLTTWVANVPHDASAAVALAALQPERAAEILDRALRYSPWSIEALAARGSAGDRAVLLLIGLAADGERALRALDALAGITTDAKVAAALRAEAAMARPLLLGRSADVSAGSD